MAKIPQKVSETQRTITGAKNLAAIRSYLQTAAKQGVSTLVASPHSPEENPGYRPPDQLR